MAQPILDYVARSPCGCVTGAITGDADKKEIAKMVAFWIRDGRTVDRIPRHQVGPIFGCRCEKPKPRHRQPSLLE